MAKASLSSPAPAVYCEIFAAATAFLPSLADDAWLTAYNLAYGGEPGNPPFGLGWPIEALRRWSLGTATGRADRARDEARSLGLAQGIESEISEPPAGYSADEARAWREANAEGREIASARNEVMSEVEPDWDAMYADRGASDYWETVEAHSYAYAARNGGEE